MPLSCAIFSAARCIAELTSSSFDGPVNVPFFTDSYCQICFAAWLDGVSCTSSGDVGTLTFCMSMRDAEPGWPMLVESWRPDFASTPIALWRENACLATLLELPH